MSDTPHFAAGGNAFNLTKKIQKVSDVLPQLTSPQQKVSLRAQVWEALLPVLVILPSQGILMWLASLVPAPISGKEAAFSMEMPGQTVVKSIVMALFIVAWAVLFVLAITARVQKELNRKQFIMIVVSTIVGIGLLFTMHFADTQNLSTWAEQRYGVVLNADILAKDLHNGMMLRDTENKQFITVHKEGSQIKFYNIDNTAELPLIK